ncbi:NAD(P)/FAD-dependent oxidoreductase [Kutzneria sp. CA-103260]|uniref:NAD(P)/FAD-dependent oxidoreductase n=1 Tax=Kutzneria sp. CA-103260 TaxID=2802641 RepID=UPI001BAAF48E|nr:FAD-dependent oxidoreductase [Kutzneria sp. CA-103260]QUQ68441.1 ferredoxin--NAD+ reductase [Kutzneria sp. CA-103260]
MDQIAIVGASAAGLTAAETLRREGYPGRITLIGDEAHPPYDRPPLSKQVLAGQWEPEKTRLRKDEQIADLNAEFRLGAPAAGLDLDAREVVLADGTRVGYDGLVVATGVAPRRLPFGHDLAGVHLLRTLEHATELRAEMLRQPKTVVIGAGFLGAEVAATARTLGLDVTLVDPLPVPMARQLGETVGKLLEELHRDNGARVLMDTGVTELLGTDGHVTGVRLTDGNVLDAGCVLVAIGATPVTDWLAGSGLTIDNGVVCDSRCQAAPNVYAAGDVANWEHPRYGRMRLEHRMNATEQGMAVARNLLGADQEFAPVPYFWTDQYDAKVQAYGLVGEGLEYAVVAGDPGERKFAALYGRDGVVTGGVGWNLPREIRKLRQAVVDRSPMP